MGEIIIQEYNDFYKQQVIEMILGIQIKEFNVPITLKEQIDLQNVPEFYQKHNGNFWIALCGNQVIGSIALIDIGKGQGALRKMFVTKEFRGNEAGISQSLLQTLFNWCKLRKINEIYLGTVSILYAAQRFYEKNGFNEISQDELPTNFPIMKVDTKFYVYRGGENE